VILIAGYFCINEKNTSVISLCIIVLKLNGTNLHSDCKFTLFFQNNNIYVKTTPNPTTPPTPFHPLIMPMIIFFIIADPQRFADGTRRHFGRRRIAIGEDNQAVVSLFRCFKIMDHGLEVGASATENFDALFCFCRVSKVCRC